MRTIALFVQRDMDERINFSWLESVYNVFSYEVDAKGHGVRTNRDGQHNFACYEYYGFIGYNAKKDVWQAVPCVKESMMYEDNNGCNMFLESVSHDEDMKAVAVAFVNVLVKQTAIKGLDDYNIRYTLTELEDDALYTFKFVFDEEEE